MLKASVPGLECSGQRENRVLKYHAKPRSLEVEVRQVFD
jgi:hypothetical protein